NLFVIRRAALYTMGNQGERFPDFDRSTLAIEPNNLLFLSYRIMQAQAQGNMRQCLDAAAQLEEFLYTKIDRADEYSSLSLLLLTLLGDCYLEVDPEKAKSFYLRIIERRGDVSVIFDRLARTAKLTKNFEEEVYYLDKLARSEP